MKRFLVLLPFLFVINCSYKPILKSDLFSFDRTQVITKVQHPYVLVNSRSTIDRTESDYLIIKGGKKAIIEIGTAVYVKETPELIAFEIVKEYDDWTIDPGDFIVTRNQLSLMVLNNEVKAGQRGTNRTAIILFGIISYLLLKVQGVI